MTNLATAQDLEDRIGRSLTAEESLRATALLTDASALIRGYTRQNFDQQTGDQVVLRPAGNHVRLPQRPVLAVQQVAIIDCDGQPSDPINGWCWDGSDKIRITGSSIKGIDDPWWPWNWAPEALQVTYDHGYTVTPADVVARACSMVLAVLLAPTQAEGLVQERIGQYTYIYGQQAGAGSPGATVRMTQADRNALARYRRTAGTIALRTR